jgi:hypothetical protein
VGRLVLAVAEAIARRVRRCSAAEGVSPALPLVPSGLDEQHGSVASVVIWEGTS